MLASCQKHGKISQRIASVALAFTLAFTLVPAHAQNEPIRPYANAPADFSDLAEGLMGAVVNISTTQTVSGRDQQLEMPQLPPGSPFQEFFEEFFNRQQQRPRSRRATSLGSGFVIDPAGIIITNNHVIDGADEIVANFADGTRLTATVIGTDPKTDIAVLRVEPTSPLQSVSLGNSADLRIGQWVMAIGNPFGFGGTVTVGIVSALNRDIRSGPYDDFIQTDASINRGNSGGPLFNMSGEVVGINTAIISPSGGSIGIGFSIPANLANNVINQILEFGSTRRGWLGVRIQPVTQEIAESLGLERPEGALVASLDPEGPAGMSGIEVGDVIVEFNETRIREMRELPRIVADTAVGSTVPVIVYRRGEPVTLQVTIAQLDEGQVAPEDRALENGEETEQPAPVGPQEMLGLSVVGLTSDLRTQYDLPDSLNGVLIVGVDPDGTASESGLAEGEVITEANQEAVSSPSDIRAQIDDLKEQGRTRILLLVRGLDGEPRFSTLPIDDE